LANESKRGNELSYVEVKLDASEAKVSAYSRTKKPKGSVLMVELEVCTDSLAEAAASEVLDMIVSENRERILDIIGEAEARKHFGIE
jgi:hypothetical protein